jgi:outer membrane protein OmpA-like peptidoglycan-associated protein
MMKKICSLLLFLFFAGMINAQDNLKSYSFGFQFSFIDFPTAQELRSNSLSDVIDSKGWRKIGRMEPAITLNYIQGLDNHFDFMSRLTTSFMRYPFRDASALANDDKFYAEADVNLNMKLLTDKFIIVPYLQAGIGAATTQKTFMAQIPLGVGLQIKIGKNTFINANSNYRIPVTANANYSLMHSIGFLGSVSNKKPKPIVAPPPPLPAEPSVSLPPLDTDGDGILDSLDLCPAVAGLAELKGCPDTDKDGIADKEDKCPEQAGLAKYDGCPIPDTDKDGINDEVDKCPDVPGVERYEGCPVPDTDKDGINDEEDKCPALAGKANEAGCPPVEYKINFANIQFKLGSAQLNAQSKKELDLLAKFLKENTDVKLYLNGHSDNTGTDERNAALSMERSRESAKYLTSKGVSSERLITEGFGSAKPLAENKSKKGRNLNRRVEFVLKRY